jgi:HJR/Mrr/RecB family endonuclease
LVNWDFRHEKAQKKLVADSAEKAAKSTVFVGKKEFCHGEHREPQRNSSFFDRIGTVFYSGLAEGKATTDCAENN